MTDFPRILRRAMLPLLCLLLLNTAARADDVVEVAKPSAARESYAPGEDVTIQSEVKNTKAFPILVVARLRVIGPDGTEIYNEEKDLGEIAGKAAAMASFTLKLPADAGAGDYSATFELRNPYFATASYFQNKGKPFVVFEVKLSEGARADPISEAKKILSRMVDAMNWRDIDALMDPVARGARVSMNGKASGAGDFRMALSSVLPFLSDLVWDAQVTHGTIDPKTGAVRLRVRSTYSAKLAEPVGVTSASLAKPKDLESEQKRITEAFNTSAEEIYEFNRAAGGQLQVTEIVSALPLDAKLLDRIALMGAEWEAKVAVFGLFYYMEQNDLGKFSAMIDDGFVNNDDNGFKHNKADFIESIKADLDHLTAIDHNVRVEDIQFSAGHSAARVPVTWDRRARIANTRSEWTVKDQKTTMTLKYDAGFKLAQIEGKPLFGNSSRMTRKTLIGAGELDGTTITLAIAISDARETAVASSSDFPGSELTNVLAPSSGSSQTFTYTGAVQTFTATANAVFTIKAWGAGGGGGGWDAGNGGAGGGGAYSTATVTLAKGDIIQIYVAQGGDSGASEVGNIGLGPVLGNGPGGFGYGTGGRGGNVAKFASGGGGGGGGSSAVTNQSGATIYLVAAGGGGGGGGNSVGVLNGGAGGAGGVSGTASAGAGGGTGGSRSKKKTKTQQPRHGV